MTNVVAIPRKISGSSGPPGSGVFPRGTLAYDETVGDLYYGYGDNGLGKATGYQVVGGLKFAKLSGADYSGTISAPFIVALSGAAGTNGYAQLIPGGANNTGYIALHQKDGSRVAYFGYANNDYCNFVAEKGRFNFSGTLEPMINGYSIWHAGNFDPSAKSNKAEIGNPDTDFAAQFLAALN